jgi:virginiamycin A acetyltransferase
MIKKFVKSKIAMPLLYRVHCQLEESTEYSKRNNDERYKNNQIRKGVILSDGTSFEGDCQIELESVFMGNVSIKSHSLIGTRNILWGGEITIGRYCQLAPYVSVYSKNHSLHTLTAYNNRRLFDSRLKDLDEYEPVQIGNDVWIGVGTTILPGVTIGCGTIIGAGSVVTKSVPAYVMAAGNPARVIKKRFSDELIELLLKWQWWNLLPSELLPFENLFFRKLPESEEDIIRAITELLNKQKESIP